MLGTGYSLNARALIVILVVALTVIGLMLFQQQAVSDYLRDSTATRQISEICLALSKKQVSAEELCQTSLPENDFFRARYQRIKGQDGEWFAERGYSYFPIVECVGGVKFQFFGRELACRGAEAVVLARLSSSSLAPITPQVP